MPGHQCQLWLICFLLLTAIPASCKAESEAVAEWKRKIMAQLSAHKRYPPAAMGQAGEARVYFVVDGSGKLISNNLVKSTGVPQLDAAALAMVANAQPFPPAPAEIFETAFMLPVVFQNPRASSGKLMSDKYLVSGKYQVPDSDIPKDDEIMREQMKLGTKMRSICRGC